MRRFNIWIWYGYITQQGPGSVFLYTPSFEVKNTFIEVSSDSDASDGEQEFKEGLLVATFIFL